MLDRRIHHGTFCLQTISRELRIPSRVAPIIYEMQTVQMKYFRGIVKWQSIGKTKKTQNNLEEQLQYLFSCTINQLLHAALR